MCTWTHHQEGGTLQIIFTFLYFHTANPAEDHSFVKMPFSILLAVEMRRNRMCSIILGKGGIQLLHQDFEMLVDIPPFLPTSNMIFLFLYLLLQWSSQVRCVLLQSVQLRKSLTVQLTATLSVTERSLLDNEPMSMCRAWKLDGWSEFQERWMVVILRCPLR